MGDGCQFLCYFGLHRNSCTMKAGLEFVGENYHYIVYDKKPFRVTLQEGKTYHWCLCGRSKSQPLCDGTHKDIYLKITHRPIRFTVEKTKDYWLCNCKQTKNRPFCDGNHKNKEIQEARVKVQTDFTPVLETQFLIRLPEADSINYLVVFLTGSTPLPAGAAGMVYWSWPDPSAPPNWQLLGHISNAKPSAIFKISNLKKLHELSSDNQFSSALGQPTICHNAQIGVAIEPDSNVSLMASSVKRKTAAEKLSQQQERFIPQSNQEKLQPEKINENHPLLKKELDKKRSATRVNAL